MLVQNYTIVCSTYEDDKYYYLRLNQRQISYYYFKNK